MPFTFTAYTIAAVSIIGLPPLAGNWSKWFLIDGALSAERLIIAAAFLISTLLNIIYLLPIAGYRTMSRVFGGTFTVPPRHLINQAMMRVTDFEVKSKIAHFHRCLL